MCTCTFNERCHCIFLGISYILRVGLCFGDGLVLNEAMTDIDRNWNVAAISNAPDRR